MITALYLATSAGASSRPSDCARIVLSRVTVVSISRTARSSSTP